LGKKKGIQFESPPAAKEKKTRGRSQKRKGEIGSPPPFTKRHWIFYLKTGKKAKAPEIPRKEKEKPSGGRGLKTPSGLSATKKKVGLVSVLAWHEKKEVASVARGKKKGNSPPKKRGGNGIIILVGKRKVHSSMGATIG